MKWVPLSRVNRILLVTASALIAVCLVIGISLSFLGQNKKTPHSSDKDVLAETTETIGFLGEISFNLPSIFNDTVTINAQTFIDNAASISGELSVGGDVAIDGEVVVNNRNLTLGIGELTASNVIYSLTAGENITITPGQNPIISANLDDFEQTTLQGESGDLVLVAGDGISIDGLTISNDDPASALKIFSTIDIDGTTFDAGSNEDTLKFVSGSGITITPDTGSKQLTITATNTSESQWTTTGSDIYYNLGNVGIGNTAPARALDVTGTGRFSGAFTLSNLSTGILHADSTGLLSSSALNLSGGSSEITGTLPIGNGGTGVTGTATNGQILIGNGAGYTLATLTAGAGISIMNGAGSITIGSTGGGGSGGSQWTSDANGTFYPTNSGLDVVLGGTSTASAKFGFINMNGGTPTFQISGTPVLTGTTLGAGVTTSSLTTVGALNSGSVTSGFGAIDIGGDNLTAGGTITFSGFSSNGGVLYTNASGVLTQVPAGTTSQILHGGTTPSFGAVVLTSEVSGILPIANGGTNANTIGLAGSVPYSNGTAYNFSSVGTTGQALISGGTSSPTWFAPTAGSVLFAGTSGILQQDNSNFYFDDLNNLFGLGTASPVSKFHVTGAATGKALSMFNETGNQDILTASSSGTTRFTIANNGNLTFTGNTSFLNTLTSAATAARTYTFPDATGTICVSTGNCAGSGTGITGSGTATQLAFFSGGSQNIASDSNLYWDNTNKLLGIGSSSPVAKLDVSGAATGKALAIFNETGNQNILTASASGTTALVLTRTGNLSLYSTTANSDSITLAPQSGGANSFGATITSSDLTADRTYTLPDATGTICLTTGNCAGVGGNGTITAVGSILTGDAFSDATADDDWLGLGAAAGRIEFDDQAIDEVNILAAKLGVGTAAPTSLFHATGAITGKALAIFDETGDQNVLTASASGTTIANLDRSGNMTIEGSLADLSAATLTINDSLSVLGAVTVTGVISDSDSALVLDDTVDIGSATTGLEVSPTGVITDLDGNVVIGDAVDLGSATTGLNIATTGVITDINGNVIIDDVVDLGSASTGLNITIDGVISDNNGDIILNDQTHIGSDTTGLQVTTAGVLSDIDGDLSINDNTAVTGTLQVSPASTDPLLISPVAQGAGAFTGTFTSADLTGARTWTFPDATGTVCLTTGNCAGTTNYWQLNSNVLAPGNAATVTDRLVLGGNTSTVHQVEINGRQTGKALFALNETGDQNILTASASGTTVANLDRSGNLAVEGQLSDLSGPTLAINDDLQVIGNDILSSGGTTALTLSGADVTVAGDLTVSGGDIIGVATTNLLNTTSTTVNFAGAATTLNVADAALTGTIDIGGVTADGASTINLATNGTSADAITIGNSNASTTLALTGGDDWSITAAGVLTLDGSTFDVDSLDFTGAGAITTGGTTDLTLNPTDEVILGDTDNIVIGGHAGGIAYNVISDSGGTPAGANINSDDDLYIEGSLEVDGTFYLDGSIDTAFTQGSVVFAGANGVLTQDNTNFFWDDSSNFLGIGTTSPGSKIDIGRPDTTTAQNLRFSTTSGTDWTIGQAIGSNDLRIGNDTLNTDFLALTTTGRMGLWTTSPLATLDLRGNSGTIPSASVSAQSAFASLVVDNSGVGDIFAASSSGLNRFVIKQNGNVGIGVNDPTALLDVNGRIAVRGSDGNLRLNAQDNGGNFYTLYSASGELTFYGGLNIRAVMTAGGNFGLGLNNSAPVGLLDVNGKVTGKALSILNETGDQNVLSASASGTTVANITRSGTLQLLESTGGTFFGTMAIGNLTANRTYTFPDEDGEVCLSSNNCSSTGDITAVGSITSGDAFSDSSADNQWLGLGASAGRIEFDDQSPLDEVNILAAKLGLGTQTPDGFLHVTGASTGKALAIFNETGNQNIITASSAGTTRFVIDNDGDVGIGNSTPDERLVVAGEGTGTMKVGDVGFASNYTGISLNGTLGGLVYNIMSSPTDQSLYLNRPAAADMHFRGGNLTQAILTAAGNFGIGTNLPTATLDVRGVSGTTPVASLSGQTALAAMMVNNDGIGDLFTASSSGTNKFVIRQNGNVGIGTPLPQQKLDVLGNFQIRDLEAQTKAYRLRTNGTGLDFEAGGANLYLSNWSGADFTGTQRNYLVLESGANIARAVGQWQWRTGAEGTTRHIIDGTTGAGIVFNDNSEATDFRVEGDTDANAFFIAGATDRVGIGTASPLGKLHVTGANVGKAMVIFNETGDQNIFTASDSGTTRFVIQKNGNVGIHTATPQTSLDVSGTANFVNNIFMNQNDGGFWLDDYNQFTTGVVRNTGGDMFLRTNSTEQVTLLSSNGNLGVGSAVTTPATKLHIGDSDNNSNVLSTLRLQRTDADSAGAVGLGTGIDFYLEDSGSNVNQAARLDVAWTGATNAAETSKMVFNLMQNGSLTEAASLSTLQRVTGDDAEFKVNGRLDQTHHNFFWDFFPNTGDRTANGVTVEGLYFSESGECVGGTFNAANMLNGIWGQNAGAVTPANGEACNLDFGDQMTIDDSLNPVFETRVTSSANTSHTVGLGFSTRVTDPLGTGDPANGIYFKYSASGNWIATTRASSTQTTTDTGVAPATGSTFQTLRIEVSSSRVKFYIDGNLEAEHTTNIPSASLDLEIYNQINSASARQLELDYIKLWQDPPPPGYQEDIQKMEQLFDIERGADYAERYPVTDIANTDFGEIMSIDPTKKGYLKQAEKAYDPTIIGVTSAKPGQVIGQASDETMEVALSGRVPVKIASDSAEIKPGDYLTSSGSEPGKAMKATRAGTVIGKALEGWTPDSGKETVLTFISLSSYDPDIYLSDLGNLSMFATHGENTGKFSLVDDSGQEINRVGRFSDAAIANLISGVINTQKLLINGIDVLDLIQSQKAASPSGTIANKQLQDMNASISALQTQTASQRQNLGNLDSRVASLEANLQYGMAGPAGFTASSAAELSLETLEAREMNISGALSVLGRTLVNDLGITGKFTAGILSINGIDDDGNATINTLGGELKIQSNATGKIDIMAGKITIDTHGNMKVAETITAKKFNVDTQEVAAASLGQATLPEGAVKLDIETSAVTSTSAIFLTPKTKISLPLSVATQKAGEFFRVEISEPVDKDVKFNWWIVN